MCWVLSFLDIFGFCDISFTEFRWIMPFLFCLFVRKIRGICLYLHKCQELSWLWYMLNILLAATECKGNREVMLQIMIDTQYCVRCLNLVMDFSLISLFDATFSCHCKCWRTRAFTHTHMHTHTHTSTCAKTLSYKAVNELSVEEFGLKDCYIGSIRRRNLFRCTHVAFRYYGQNVEIILKPNL